MGGHLQARIDLLGRFDGLRQRLGRRRAQLSVLTHIDSSDFERGVQNQGQRPQPLPRLGLFQVGDDQPAFTPLVATRRPTDAMHIRLSVWREAHLDHVGDVGEVHPSCRHV